MSSQFWEHNAGSWERLPAAAHRFGPLTPVEAAQAIIEAIEHDRRLVLRPRALHALRIMNALFPRQIEQRTWHRGA